MKSKFFTLWILFGILLVNVYHSLSFTNGYYIPNYGQWENRILFVSQNSGYNLFVTNDGLNFDYYKLEQNGPIVTKQGHLVKLEISGAALNNYSFSFPSTWKLAYLKGNYPNKWVRDICGYKEIIFNNIYPNIDFKIKFQDNNPRYDFIVKPGGNPNNIIIKFDGAKDVQTDGKSIRFFTRFGEIINGNLFAFQNENEIPAEVQCKFKQVGENRFSFEIGKYDETKDLIIDPIVMMSYLGGSNNEQIVEMKEISTGILLAAGWTESPNFPITTGAYDDNYNDLRDVFICKLNVQNAKRELLYCTFLGGGGTDYPVGMSIDDQNNVYIGGTTNSTDFPLHNSLTQSINGLYDIFLTKFTPDLKNLVYSTYGGGNKDDIAVGAQLAPDKGFIVSGYTESTNLPVTGGAYQTKLKGRKDIFVFKVSSSGQLIDYCTYIGGGDDDIPYAMAVSETGNIFLTGTTKSGDFPMVPYRTGPWGTILDEPYDRTFNGGWDAFCIKILGEGKLDFSTYFGGTADDIGLAVTYTSDQKIIFSGITYKETTNPSFPISQNAFQNTHKGNVETFVASLSNIIESRDQWGNTRRRQDLLFSTYLGGSGNDYPKALSLYGNFIHILGTTNSTNFPIVNNPTGKKIGKYDIYYVQMTTDGSSVSYSDIYGTLDDDSASAMILTSVGDYYIAGVTNSKNLTQINPIVGSGYSGGNDILLLKYSSGDLKIDYPVGNEKICPNSNINIKWSSETFTATDTFNVDFKTNLNPEWSELASNVKGFSYNWFIPPTFFADSVWIRISHKRGVVATSTIPFRVYELPSILESKSIPENPKVCEGDSVILAVRAIGSKIKYQWLFNGSEIQGATDSIYVIRNIDQSKKGKYKAIVSGPCPVTVETPEFNVDFVPSTKILAHSSDTTVKKGENLSLYATAKGEDLKYQWYKDEQKILGATENIYSVSNVSILDAGQYMCKITGTCGTDSTPEINVTIDTVIVGVEDQVQNGYRFYLLNDILTIEIPINKSQQIHSVSLYNSLGQMLNPAFYELETQNNRIVLNLSALPTGIYFVEVNDGNKTIRIPISLVR